MVLLSILYGTQKQRQNYYNIIVLTLFYYYRAASLDRLTRVAHFVIERIGHSSPPKLELAITAVEPAGLVVLGLIIQMLVAITHCQKRPESIYVVIKKTCEVKK